ncbi:MAG: MBOAT family protein [Synergistaceae bacterium]|nr:MBOAT family protein [Synergistaceae bacterium]
MLFNSPEFLFAFLPVTFIAYHSLASLRLRSPAMAFLVLASLFYYSYWNPRNLPVILISMAFNFLMGRAIADASDRRRRLCFTTAGVAANLLLLGWFKYAAFIAQSLNSVFAGICPVPDVPLPLAISFFTFTQIAYLVDVSTEAGVRRYGPITYGLFITVFPQLIAGPILYHKDLIPQFSKPEFLKLSNENICAGLTFLTVGLAKKVLVADGLSRTVDVVFAAAPSATFAEAWLGALAYALQIYFDFSGYSEMAIGLCLMFNMRLPINFDSPYKSTSIIEFWRRWHMTLSAFLKKYLYIPLGGSRRGPLLRARNLMLTMLLGGLWHGAGWTFVIWGGLHGLYLSVNHLWRKTGLTLPKPIAWPLTFAAVVCAWVFFRAESLGDAVTLLSRMLDFRGMSLASLTSVTSYPTLGARVHLIYAAIALTLTLLPNIQRVVGYTMESSGKPVAKYPLWLPALTGGLLFLALREVLFGTAVSEFLYFNF